MTTYGGVRHDISHQPREVGSSRRAALPSPVVLTGLLVAGELLLLTLVSTRAVDVGEALRYDRTFSPRPLLIAAVLVPVVFVVTRFAARQVLVREVPTVIATVVGGMTAQALLFGLGRHQVTKTVASDTFRVTAERYGTLAVLREHEELARALPMHAKANMPGKVVFYGLLRQVTTSDTVLALVVLGISAFGGVLVYLIGRRLFESRQAALFGVLLYFFVPARTNAITALNNVTVVLALLLVVLVLRYLDKPSPVLAVVGGLLGYGALLFDPAVLLVGPVVLALMVRHAVVESLPARSLVQLAVGACAAFAVAHVGMRAALGFDIFDAAAHVERDARSFVRLIRPNWADWPAVNLREFAINAGLALSLLVVAAFVDMVVALLTRRAPLRQALVDPIWLLTGTVVLTVVALSLAALNRGEVSRLWLPLAAILALVGGAICAERLPSWVFPVVLSCLVAQVVFGQQFIRSAMVVLPWDYLEPVEEMTHDVTYLVDAFAGVFLVTVIALAVRHHRHRSPGPAARYPSAGS